MNAYTTEFFCHCPNNQIRVRYRLRIETRDVLAVEEILSAVELIDEGFHEEVADQLFARFGGVQTLVAEHHGVTIETTRRKASKKLDFLDQTVGGMAGTPGY